MLLSRASSKASARQGAAPARRRLTLRLAPVVARASPKEDIERVSFFCLFFSSLARPLARRRRRRRRFRLPHPPPPQNNNQQVQKVLEQTIKEAEEVCEGDAKTGECAAAFDAVEEVSAALAHKKTAMKASGAGDPLEAFCDDNPDADECRIYDD